MDDERVTTSAVADLIGCSEREIQRLIRNGIIKAPRQAPGTVRRWWSEKDIEDAREAYVKHTGGGKKRRREGR